MKNSRVCNRICRPVFLLAVVTALTLACAQEDVSEEETLAPGVEGIVTLTPSFDGELVENQLNPPELVPVPLPGATVYLISREAAGGVPVFVDSTMTDSTGHYVLPASPGLYYVGVASDNVLAPILVNLPGDTAQQQRRIHALVGLNIVEGHTVEQPFNIVEIAVN